MFGKGVYFADVGLSLASSSQPCFDSLNRLMQMMSKSANYCYAHLSHNTGLLLLCEVAAKPFHELKDADYDADKGCKATVE